MATKPSYNSFTLFKRLWTGYLKNHIGLLAIAMLFMIIEGSTLGGLSYMLQPMFDLVMVKGQAGAIWFVATAILMLFVIRGVTGIIHRTLLTKVSYEASTQIQVDLLQHTLNLDNSFHSKTSPGTLIERVQGDVISIQHLWNTILVNAGRDTIALLSLIGVAISIDWVWTLVTIMGAPILLLPSLAVQRYVRRKSGYLREIASDRTLRLDEIFHGIIPVKLNRMESYQLSRFSNLSKDWVKSTIKTVAGQASIPALVDLAVGFGFFCVLLYGGPQIISGEKSVGQFMSFFTAMALAFQPMRRLGNVASNWEIMAASLNRIFNLFDTKPEIKDTEEIKFKAPKTFDICFDEVSLKYDSLPVLNKLSFSAQHGKTTAFVGESGAGKSTVFNALTRLVDPESGNIKIGGTNTQHTSLKNLRGLFSVVSQDALLFDETLIENILLGNKNISKDRLNQVLDDANVTKFLSSLPNGLNTRVGPRGSNLSGGQRQRIAIARALLRDTPILLLDEATSALDAESEKFVQEALEKLSKGRTTLVIAHRLSTIHDADQIIVLSKGEIAEAGTHETLISQKGVYSNLYKLQSMPNKDIQESEPQSKFENIFKNPLASNPRNTAPINNKTSNSSEYEKSLNFAQRGLMFIAKKLTFK